MATIITRETGATAKNSPLTNAELDANFVNLNTAKLEIADLVAGRNVDVITASGKTTVSSKGTVEFDSLTSTNIFTPSLNADNSVLTGLNSAALHRSPNAVTAMFVYDTGKDSDGGAWTEKCQHTSWYNEALNGKWLGAAPDELSARLTGAATTGAELVTNGAFTSGITGWTANGNTLALVNGQLQIVGTAFSYQAVSVVIGKTYLVKFDFISSAVNPNFRIGFGAAGNSEIYSGNATVVGKALTFTATTSTVYINIGGGASGSTSLVDNISVREVTALTTASGDYYQSTVDGKFYRLWKNLLKHSADFSNALWSKNNGATVAAQGNAWRITDPGDTASHISQSLSGLPSNGQYSFQIDFERQASGIFVVGLQNFWCYVNHATLTTLNETYYQGSNASSSCVVLSGTRCRLTVTLNHVAPNTFAIYPALGQMGGDVNATVARTATGYLDVYSAQLEYGSTATAYEVKTVDGSITETFRGNKADFPRLAGIVGETGSVTIYDLTEAGRPMWMRFVGSSSGNNQNFLTGTAGPGSIFVANGVMGVAYGSNGLIDINFCLDKARQIYSGGVFDFSPNRMASRNSLPLRTQGAIQPAIANNAVNAVAMTVLPDAPVDAVTGLQVPTIAVATAGGVSVIKHNGTVVNSSVTSSILKIAISKNDNRINTFATSFGNYWHYSAPIGTLDASFVLSPVRPLNGGLDSSWFGTPVQIISNNAISATIAGNAPVGVHLLRSQPTGVARTTMARIAPTFNTGMLIGDIRRAYLADTDVGNVSGTELVVNGTFDTDLSGWTVNQSTAWNAGALRIESNGLPDPFAYTTAPISTVVGATYRVVYNVTNPNASQATIRVRPSTTNTTSGIYEQISGTDTSITVVAGATRMGVFDFIARSASTYLFANLGIGSGQTGHKIDLLDVSYKAIVLDRSYKAQGASITGTLTKTQVALGSQLVAYSGFSA